MRYVKIVEFLRDGHGHGTVRSEGERVMWLGFTMRVKCWGLSSDRDSETIEAWRECVCGRVCRVSACVYMCVRVRAPLFLFQRPCTRKRVSFLFSTCSLLAKTRFLPAHPRTGATAPWGWSFYLKHICICIYACMYACISFSFSF